MSSPAPFSFEDFTQPAHTGAVAQFVNLFAEGKRKGDERGDAANDVASAEDEARKVFEDAYVQGEKAGFEMGMRRAESIAKRLERQIAEVVEFKSELRDRYEKLAVELSVLFAEAIVLRECGEKRETVGMMIKKALEACDARDEIVVRVRPNDADHIGSLASDHLRIVKDDSLKEPGFVIETNVGDIDGRLSTQIEELRASLIGFHAE